MATEYSHARTDGRAALGRRTYAAFAQALKSRNRSSIGRQSCDRHRVGPTTASGPTAPIAAAQTVGASTQADAPATESPVATPLHVKFVTCWITALHGYGTVPICYSIAFMRRDFVLDNFGYPD